MSRARAASLALAALLLLTGCGDSARRAQIYRLQQGYWKGYHAAQEARLGGVYPDSSQLLALRENFTKTVDPVIPTLEAMGKGTARTPLDTRLLRVVGHGEIQAARLAMDANRPDLAMERCQALVRRAEGDTAVTRQADIMIVGALRRMGKHDEAAKAMHDMLVRYVPHPPDSTGVEDFLLTVPTLLVDMYRDLGDEAGMKREMEQGRAYYDGLLAKGGLTPGMEVSVRLHLVHSYLELGRKSDALAELDAAEGVVTSHPQLSSHIPEIRYTRVRLIAMDSKDPATAVASLERIALDFPQSRVAPLALFDAAFLHEKAGHSEAARNGYEAVAARYPRDAETASTALLRQAMLEDRAGQWEEAKAILESVPTKYPSTPAGAQAPISMAEHYQRKNDPAGFKTSLRRAVEIYQRMLGTDSLSAQSVTLRWNLMRVYANLDDSRGVFATVDGMAAAYPTSPVTARALVVAAKYAESKKLKPQEAAYLNRFLQMFPNAPAATEARAKLRELAKS